MAASARRTVVACLGASSTAGKGQAFDWMAELERLPENRNFEFRNFGVGGDLAYHALKRVSAVAASRPGKVIVWIGGNDVLASVFDNVRRFFEVTKGLPRSPSPGWFRQCLTTMVMRLRAETTASLALCSHPPIGEADDASHPKQQALNRLLCDYAMIVAEIARKADCRYVPLHEELGAAIRGDPGPPLTEFRFSSLYFAAFRSIVLRQSPDEIGRRNGWKFHSDGIHLNRRAGLVVARLIQEFVRE
jgi:lysophospholipase L1-like esterase